MAASNNPQQVFTPSALPEKCGSCHWFQRFKVGNQSLGECHAEPPIIWTKGVDHRYGVFPTVNDVNYCGAYEVRKGE